MGAGGDWGPCEEGQDPGVSGVGGAQEGGTARLVTELCPKQKVKRGEKSK